MYEKKMLMISILSCSFFVGCEKEKKSELNEDFVILKNAPYTVVKENGIKVEVSDVFSRISSFKREIKIDPGKGKDRLSEIYVTFLSSDKDNIYQRMASDPYSVNGYLTIEIGGQVILKKKVVNGVWKKTELIAYKVPGPTYNASLSCTAGTVHDCVAWEIDDMNWIEYGACLASAPACYATLWASCTWEVCTNHMEYTNPVN